MFIESCVVGVEQVSVEERPRYENVECHRGRLTVERRLASRLLIIVARNLAGMARNYVLGWLSAKRNGRIKLFSLTLVTMGAKRLRGVLGLLVPYRHLHQRGSDSEEGGILARRLILRR